MGMRVLRGRDFTWFDRSKATPQPVIVNEAFVRRFFPDRDALGGQFGYAGAGGVAAAENRIVGVVTDAKYRSLREPIPPTVYDAAVDGFADDFILHLRTGQHPEALIEPVRKLLRSLDPELPIVEARTLHAEVEDSLWQERLLAGLSAVFGAIAALLAAIGLYGALDYAVESRRREIGVRMALGAEPARIARLVSGTTAEVIGVGVAAGILGYAAAAEGIRRVLYGVESWDPAVLATVLLLVATIAAAAAGPAAWRAAHTDPAAALRSE
jgi:ABC-type antimicrobial peptide transport system permease subunit